MLIPRVLRTPLLLGPAFSLFAQTAAKLPLNHRYYDGWRTIQNQVLSRDDKFLAHSLLPEEGDSDREQEKNCSTRLYMQSRPGTT